MEELPPALLRVWTRKLRFELRGPYRAEGAFGEASGTLAISCGPADEIETVEWMGSGGEIERDVLGVGPALFEWVTYELFVESLAGDPIAVGHRDPTLIASVRSPAGHPEMAHGSIAFRGQIGRTSLNVLSQRRHLLEVELEVFPTKLDYASDYESLLADVTAAQRALALEYLRATSRGVARASADEPTDLEFATLLRYHVAELERGIQYLAAHPHRGLVRDVTHTQVERIARSTSATRQAIRRGQGKGPWVAIAGLGPVRSRLPAQQARETLDTPEHRWLRTRVSATNRRLGEILVTIDLEIAAARKAKRATARRIAERDELEGVRGRLARLTSLEPLAEAKGRVPQGFSSLTLMRMPGYREAVMALLALDDGLALEPGDVDSAVKDVEVLYEMWCFLRIVTLLYKVRGGRPDLSGLFERRRSTLRTRLTYGASVEVAFAGESTTRVAFNRSFPGYTGTQRPDLLLVLEAPGWPALYVPLDAKYRLDASPGYLKRFKIAGPPIDAVNQLHRYRDALVSDPLEANRPVVVGAALFPLDAKAAEHWEAAPLSRALDDYGIGALPFLPSNESHVEAWLIKLMSKTSSALARAGPAFAGEQELDRRRNLAHAGLLLLAPSVAEIRVALAQNSLEVVMPGGCASPVHSVALVVEDIVAARTSVTPRAQVIRMSYAPGNKLKFEVAAWQSSEARLSGIATIGYPAVTTELALDLAGTANELALRTESEWDLLELLERQGFDPTVKSTRGPDYRLQGIIEVDTEGGAASVSAVEPNRFEVSRGGQRESAQTVERAVALLRAF
jgi:hypothetical protein